LSSISESLEDAGHTVMTARDGEEALARCQARGFDVVVLDVRLPKSDGVMVLKQLRRSWPETKVILMTAFADVAQAVAALKEGAYDYLTKPFDLDELLIRFQRICEQRALQREL